MRLGWSRVENGSGADRIRSSCAAREDSVPFPPHRLQVHLILLLTTFHQLAVPQIRYSSHGSQLQLQVYVRAVNVRYGSAQCSSSGTLPFARLARRAPGSGSSCMLDGLVIPFTEVEMQVLRQVQTSHTCPLSGCTSTKADNRWCQSKSRNGDNGA